MKLDISREISEVEIDMGDASVELLEHVHKMWRLLRDRCLESRMKKIRITITVEEKERCAIADATNGKPRR